jgi:pimeloyl-ACP methyl ester carboxylesterase
VIAHSFGTYIVAGALEKYAEVKLDSFVLCGSIVRRDFPWSHLIPGQVKRVLNDCGGLDIWAKLVAWFIPDAGPSGASGFGDEAGGQVQQRLRPRFRHSDYFYRLNYQQTWIPFLKGESVVRRAEAKRGVRNWRFLVSRAAVVLALFGLAVILWHLIR